MLEENEGSSRISDADSPGALELVTGSPLNAYRQLLPDDELYSDFLAVWRRQGAWDRDTHFTFWRIGLQLWPRTDGPVEQYEMLSWWVWSWRQSGLTDTEIADRLGRQYDTLRKKKAFHRADQHDSERRGEWVRAPLVIAAEIERRPHQLETWGDPRLSQLWPESVLRLRRQFTDLTREGARGKPVSTSV